jgi:hypothetical protein
MDDAHDDDPWSQAEVDQRWVQDEIDRRIAAWGGPAKPTVFVRGTVIAATMLALAAVGYGITATKGATHTAPLTSSPPAIPVPATVDPVPDAAMDVPPVLTPSLTHGHPSRLLHSQTTAHVLPTADTATAPQPVAVPVPEVAPAPVQAVPVPEQTPTVQEPQPTTTWAPQYTYPTFQPQRRYSRSGSSAHHHHGRNYDYDHDGDSH